MLVLNFKLELVLELVLELQNEVQATMSSWMSCKRPGTGPISKCKQGAMEHYKTCQF